MIIFNIYAAIVGVFALIPAFITMGLFGDPVSGFGIGAFFGDLLLRLIVSGDGSIPLFDSSRGGTLFFIVPVWLVGLPVVLLGVAFVLFGILYGSDEKPATPTISVQEENARHAEPAAPIPTGRLVVESDPPGAEVTANLVAEGPTPAVITLARGTEVEVTVEQQGYLPAHRKLRLSEETTTISLKLEPGAKLQLKSTPPGASVELDGERLGKTPLEIDVPTARKGQLHVTRPGFSTRTLRVGGRRPQRQLDVTLRPLPLSQLPLDEGERRELSELRAQIATTKPEVAKAEVAFARAQAELARRHADSRATIASKVEAENERDDAQAALEALRADLEDYSQRLKTLEQAIRNRLDEEAD
ncbi:MAG: PEGA domain-containing protein [Myxococcales bacterium]|nr:PEGA domain-containing protein [Myxococcales bacterium]MCB9647947.1 PEGA domain-containing protein [Deltaproteobacteria bacterium]